MNECDIKGCLRLKTVCEDCGRVVCEKTFPKVKEWEKFVIRKYSPFGDFSVPYDGRPFLACIWGGEAGAWVAQAVYVRRYDATNRCAGKYEFFYVAQTDGADEKFWEIKIEERPFPITHWMPLPERPHEC